IARWRSLGSFGSLGSLASRAESLSSDGTGRLTGNLLVGGAGLLVRRARGSAEYHRRPTGVSRRPHGRAAIRDRIPRVTRVVSAIARAGLAVAIFLLLLALGRWSPIHAEPPLDLRALPVAGAAVLLAVAAGVSGQERRPRPLRPFVAAWIGSVLALGLCVFLRPRAGPTLRIDAPLVTTWRPFS